MTIKSITTHSNLNTLRRFDLTMITNSDGNAKHEALRHADKTYIIQIKYYKAIKLNTLRIDFCQIEIINDV